MSLIRSMGVAAAAFGACWIVISASAPGAAFAAAAPAVPDPALAGLAPAVLDDLVAANRILASQGVLDAFGHVSMRDPRDPNHYLLARGMAAALVTARDIIVSNLDSQPIDPAQIERNLNSERFIHGEIYKMRPDVMAVVHSHSPAVIPFGASDVAFRAITHNAGFLGDRVPVFEIRKLFGADTNLLVDSPARGKALAMVLGSSMVALMRGHGDVVVGQNIKIAVWNAYYTEINARLVWEAVSLGGHVRYLSPGETRFQIDRQLRYAEHPYADRTWALWKREAMAEDFGK